MENAVGLIYFSNFRIYYNNKFQYIFESTNYIKPKSRVYVEKSTHLFMTIIFTGKCQKACTLEYEPQCGSDGKNYANECMMSLKTCETGGKVSRSYSGECGRLTELR